MLAMQINIYIHVHCITEYIRDCSLFIPKGGPVFRVGGGGVKFSKSLKKGRCFSKIQIRGRGKLLETVVSTLV